MNQGINLVTKPILADVRKKFEAWRATRGKRTQIPQELWDAAVKLSPDYTPHQISKALHLDYVKLKNLILSSGEAKLLPSHGSPSFIEIDLGKRISDPECVVELEKRDGSKMKMYFKGEVGFDLMELGKSFLK